MTADELEIIKVLALMASFWALVIIPQALRRSPRFRRLHDGRAGKAVEFGLYLAFILLALHVLTSSEQATQFLRRLARNWPKLLPLLPGALFWIGLAILYARHCVFPATPPPTTEPAPPQPEEV